MTIYAAHNTLAGIATFTYGGTPTTITTAATIDSPFTPAVVRMSTTGLSSFKIPFGTPVSSGWVHFALAVVTAGSSTYDLPPLVLSSGGTGLLRLLMTNGVPSLQVWDGAVWNTVAGPYDSYVPWANGTHTEFDVYFDIADTGTFKLFVNRMEVMSYSGDTFLTAATTVDSADFQALVSGINNMFSQIILASEKTVGMKCFSATLEGAGASSDMTGAYTTVDEEGYFDDTDKVTSGTAGQVTSFTFENMPGSAQLVPRAVQVNARCQKSGGAAPEQIALGLRASGTNYYGADKALTTSFAGYNEIWNVDPSDSSAWTNTKVNALEVALRSAT